ncbi:MAG: type II secretion system protein GspG [Myxococcota bacterium]
MARRQHREGVSLPWEERGAWLRGLLAGQRWKVVLLVLAVLGAGFLVFRNAQHQSRVRRTRIAIAEVERAIAAFRTELGRCPRSAVELVHPPAPGHRRLSEMPLDGWGRELWINCPGHFDPNEADVVSAGPSGSFFVDDNVQ